MKISADSLHDLINLQARLKAILSLLAHPEAAPELDVAEVDRDFRRTLVELEQAWSQAVDSNGS